MKQQKQKLTEETSQEETVDEEENYDTGDASLDNIRNQDEIGRTGTVGTVVLVQATMTAAV